MDHLYKKDPLGFALMWIGIYCVLQSLANAISAKIGISRSANAVLALGQSAYMLRWLRRNGLLREFHINKPSQRAENMLYYLPLVLVSTSNLWLGVHMSLTPAELSCHILLMLCVGFLEELIFRGFLFEALGKKSRKSAAVVSSLTFGAGHILNLFNGSGMGMKDVLFQILLAVLFGFLFVMVYVRSGSLLPCILSHQTINILSAFSAQQAFAEAYLPVSLAEAAVILFYLAVLMKAPEAQSGKEKPESD